jgi:hypothetical protein
MLGSTFLRVSGALTFTALVALASCGTPPPPTPPPLPPAAPPPNCDLNCSLRGPQGGCSPGVNCPLQVQWADSCVLLNPGAFSEDIDFGDGTKTTVSGAGQGCGFDPCPTPNTAYNNNYNHIFKSAQTFQVKVTVHDTAFTKDCLIPFPVTVDQPK